MCSLIASVMRGELQPSTTRTTLRCFQALQGGRGRGWQTEGSGVRGKSHSYSYQQQACGSQATHPNEEEKRRAAPLREGLDAFPILGRDQRLQTVRVQGLVHLGWGQ